jgi:hypothetical protein
LINKEWLSVGYYIDGNLVIEKSFVFPGLTSSIPDGSNFKIKLTTTKDPLEPDGTIEPLVAINALVIDFIIGDINESEDILPYFDIEVQYLEGCGTHKATY